VQGYREEDWHTARTTYKTADAIPGPVKFEKPFWLRICLSAGYMLLYLDGRFTAAYPLHNNSAPADGSPIRVMVSTLASPQ
jgi:hypothetical protein